MEFPNQVLIFMHVSVTPLNLWLLLGFLWSQELKPVRVYGKYRKKLLPEFPEKYP